MLSPETAAVINEPKWQCLCLLLVRSIYLGTLHCELLKKVLCSHLHDAFRLMNRRDTLNTKHLLPSFIWERQLQTDYLFPPEIFAAN